jgi:hypothetical protein
LESLEIFDVPKKIPRYSGDGITIWLEYNFFKIFLS